MKHMISKKPTLTVVFRDNVRNNAHVIKIYHLENLMLDTGLLFSIKEHIYKPCLKSLILIFILSALLLA